MELTEFRIGETFWCSGRQWRCTDKGTRTVVAIRLDHTEIVTNSSGETRSLNRHDAEAAGWFKGPPYAVAEVVFDEHDQVGCTVEPDPEDSLPAQPFVRRPRGSAS